MREIAGLRSRPLDNGSVLGQHGIEFFDQRLHFGGKAAFEPKLATFAHGRQRAAQTLKWKQRDHHLDDGDQ